MRYLAIDFGDKRIGLALCDPSQTVVSPIRQIERRTDRQAVEEIAAIVGREQVEAVVVGLPINMDGTEGPQAKRVRDFAKLLADRIALPFHFQNEQLTSFSADERLAERRKAGDRKGLTRAGRKQRQDSLAAAIILEDFLRSSPSRSQGKRNSPSPSQGEGPAEGEG